MNLKNRRSPALWLCLSLILSLLSCSIDHGIEPLLSSIEGQITFSGSWPAVPEEVRLVSATTFPPTGIADISIGEKLPADVDVYDYKYYVDPGDYKLIGVIWRAKDTTWDILSICSVYFEGGDSLSPGEIVILTDTSHVFGINMHVNRSQSKKITDTKIQGNIIFNGDWPATITDARVIATTRFSINPIQLPTLLDIAFSGGITPGEDSVSYSIRAFPGTFAATGVVFFKEGQSLSLGDILYTIQVKGLSVAPYTIEENQHLQGPGFQIQF